jgi:phytoene dehydrogenase-like protein
MKNGQAKGVVLENGDEIYADVVSSSVDPRLTFMKMVGENTCPTILRRSEALKYRGSSGKVNLALDGLPNFKALPGQAASARRHLDFAERRLHGARLRRSEVWTLLASALHRHGDSEFD